MKTTSTVTAQLYVGTYAKYNNGSLAGEWVDLTQFNDVDEFTDYIKQLHADEEDPEFMFQDYEGFPECFYAESMGTEGLNKLFEFINMDEDDRKMIEMYADATGYSIDDISLSKAKDRFHGTADSEADFAERIAEEWGDIPKDFPSWITIDWESSWNCSLRHDYNTAEDEDGTIWFFLNH